MVAKFIVQYLLKFTIIKHSPEKLLRKDWASSQRNDKNKCIS